MTDDPSATRTVLITGSSSGIGYATAKHFQQQGWNVAATMRNPEKRAGLETLERVKVLELDQEYLVDPDVTDYQPTVEKMMSAYSKGDILADLSLPEDVAEVVYNAATDDGTRLRYLAGADAARYMELREHGFDGFRSMVRENFLGLKS